MAEERASIGLDFPELEKRVEELRELVTVLRELQGLSSSGIAGSGGGVPSSVTMNQATLAAPPNSSLPVTVASTASAVAGTSAISATVSQQSSPATGIVSVAPAQGMMSGGGPATYVSGGVFGHWNAQTGQMVPLAFDPAQGQFFNAQNGAYLPGVGWPGAGSGGTQPTQPTPAKQDNFFQAIGGMAAVYETLGATKSAAQMFAESSAAGRPFYAERLAPAAATIGFMAAGALIGSMFAPGVGTAVGAGIGAGVGSIYGELIKPGIEKDIQVRELGQLLPLTGYDLPRKQFYEDIINKAVAGGYDPAEARRRMNQYRMSVLPTDVLEELQGQLLTGTELPYQTYYDVYKRMPHYARRQTLRTLSEARWSEMNAARYGEKMLDDDFVSSNLDDILVGSSWGKELQSARTLKMMGFEEQADDVLKGYFRRVKLEGEEKVAGASVSLAGTRLQLAARYGGSQGAANALPGAQAAMSRKASALRNLAAEMRKRGDVYQAEVLDIQAEETMLQSTALEETYFSAREQETQAMGAYFMGQANRGFERSLYSGAPAASLPWEQRMGAATQMIGRLQSDMAAREAAGKLSPAERYQYMEQIAQLQHQVTTVIPREREQAVNRESVARVELQNIREQGEVVTSTLRGSSLDQTRTLDARVTALSKERELMEQILSTSKYLTQEERLQLQARSESLKVQIEQTKVQAELARSVAREGIFQTGQVEKRAETRLTALQAGTSTEITQASIQGMRNAEADVKFYEGEISKLKAEGYDENHERVRDLRQKQAASRVSAAEQRSQLASVPLSPEQREKRAELQAEASITQMGLGSFGDFRANLQQQMGLATERLRDIDSRERELKKQGIQITPEMKAQFAEQRAQAKVDLAGLFMQYEEGWDQRLISEVYNMPGNASLIMSQFTHREAARAGITRRAFGGSKEQTEKMRTLFPRMMQMLGSGHPEGLTDRGIAEARDTNINLRVRIEDNKGNPLTETSYQINRTKTANDVNVNAGAQRSNRPSG